MMATLQQLVKVKSALAEDLERYYMALLEKRDRTPWYRVGKVIRASEVAVPARVLKDDTRPPRLPVPGQAGEGDGAKDLAHNYFDPEIALYYEEPTLDKRREEVLWKEELQRLRQATAFKPVVIIGAPGGGKSFLTDTTVIELTSEALTQLREQTQPLEELPLPIHLELADLAQQKLPDDLAAALLELLRTRYAISARLDEWMQAKLKTNDCWLMLDALDQVPETDRPQLQERLGLLETQPDWRCRVVLTCRTANYDRAQLPWNEVTEYELSPFRPQEIRQFVGRWFDSDKPRGESLRQALSRNYSLSHACRTPLLVTLTCLAHEEIAVTEETRRVDLYAHVLRGLVRRAWKTNPLNPHDPHIGDVLRPLPAIARKLFESRPESNQFTENEVYQAIKAAPDLPSAPIPFRQELFDAGLLVGAGLSRIGELQFSFLHRSFLEYLNACALDNQVEKEGWGAIATLIDKKAWHPAWHESIAFLAGKLKNPIALLELLADLDSDDLFRHRLCLAAHCLPELTAHNTLKTILYLDKSTVEYKDKLQTLTQCIARDVFNIWLADYQ